jgi:hypothetical protein
MIPIRLSPHDPTTTRWRLRLLVGALALVLGGCAAIAQRAADRFSTNLGRAILNQDDPATVRDGLPAYLLLLDGMIEGDYARRATCIDRAGLCAALERPFPEFETALQREDDVPALFALAGAWATWIQAHSEGYEAIADIPRVEAILRRVVQLEPAHDRGMPWVYLGVLGSLRPEAVGGRPEQGRDAFERALAISQQRNL